MAGAPAPETAVTVAVDANGADLGPREVAAGAARAAAESGVRVLLFGPQGEIGDVAPGVEVVDAPLSIAKAPDPVRAARSTPDASIVRAARAVAEGRAQALVAGGSTGAALAAGLFHIKRAPGIYRPALALALPVPRHPVTLLDVGANTEARPEHLVQFAFMGAAFARAVLGVRRPRVGLLSNGAEVVRGSELVLAAHAALAERAAGSDALEFVGNVEGDGVTTGAADVVVSDGFTGNVALKLIEGVSQTILQAVRDAARATPRSKLGGALLRPSLRGFRAEIDPEEHGGAYLLGLRRLGVVPHGRFTRVGIGRAIERAALGVRLDVVGRTHEALAQAGALRTTPPAAEAGALRSPPPAEADAMRTSPAGAEAGAPHTTPPAAGTGAPPSGSAASVSPA
jgi:glycerol-3-phosphate acyltransferase PlsX